MNSEIYVENKMYCLRDDEDGRWYVIPVDKIDEFDEWSMYADGDQPEWAYSLNQHPSYVSFPWWSGNRCGDEIVLGDTLYQATFNGKINESRVIRVEKTILPDGRVETGYYLDGKIQYYPGGAITEQYLKDLKIYNNVKDAIDAKIREHEGIVESLEEVKAQL